MYNLVASQWRQIHIVIRILSQVRGGILYIPWHYRESCMGCSRFHEAQSPHDILHKTILTPETIYCFFIQAIRYVWYKLFKITTPSYTVFCGSAMSFFPLTLFSCNLWRPSGMPARPFGSTSILFGYTKCHVQRDVCYQKWSKWQTLSPPSLRSFVNLLHKLTPSALFCGTAKLP